MQTATLDEDRRLYQRHRWRLTDVTCATIMTAILFGLQTNCQEPRDFRNRLFLVSDELAGVRDLLGRQGRGGTKPHAPRLRRDPAGAGALHDQGSLEIRDAGEHGQHHAPGLFASTSRYDGKRQHLQGQ